VVAPWNTTDNLGLMRSAIRDNDPVIFLENEMMYNIEFDTPEIEIAGDFTLPIGKCNVEREGTDITITAFAKMVGFSLAAANILERDYGVSAEVINLRSIRPLDREGIIKSVKKTNRIVNVEEGWPQHGVGSEIAALLMESEGFDYLDAPMERVAGADIPMPYSKSIE